MSSDNTELLNFIVSLKQNWNHSKVNLLLSHLIFAIDETKEMCSCPEEIVNMLEAEKLLSELILDLKKVIKNPHELYTRPDTFTKKTWENQENQEDDEVD